MCVFFFLRSKFSMHIFFGGYFFFLYLISTFLNWVLLVYCHKIQEPEHSNGWGEAHTHNCHTWVLTISRLLEIDIGISKGTTSNNIATNADGQNWSSRREFLEQNCFSDIRVQIAYIEWRHCDFPSLFRYFHTRQIPISMMIFVV